VSRLSWPSRNQPESGFTLIEVMVAMVIISTVLVVMGATMYTAFGSIGFSRQRGTATQLANQAMEQIKAMNFNDLEMSTGDVAGDSLIACSATCLFAGRTIPTVSSGTLPTSPINPHISTQTPTPGVSVYTIASYVTFDTVGNTQNRVATVRVSWTHPAQGTNALVQIESTIFANGALASPQAHAWSANANDSAGNVSISASTFLTGTLASVTFGPGSANATIGADGSATAVGTVAPSTLQLLGQALLATTQSTTSASSSPGQGVNAPAATVVSDSGPLGSGLSSLLGLNTGVLGITGGVGVTATSQALAASSANGSANLSNGNGGVGTMPNSSLPYAQGLAQQSGPVSLGLNLALLSVLGIPIGSTNISLLNVTPLGNSTPDLATVCQQTNSGAPCVLPQTPNLTTGVSQSAAGAAIFAQAQKSFSSITVLPNLTPPLLDLQGFTAAASATAGPGISGSGKASASALVVKILGTSYPLSSLLTGVVSPLTNVASVLGNLGVKVSLTFGGPSTSGNSAMVSSPIVLTISLSLAGLINVNLTINLGTVSATASYS
jgi:prepilin-type N-terminal cleavage/methylation domain-containing protein